MIAVRLVIIVATIVCLLGVDHSTAQEYPTRPVRFIVPTSPAGITDIAARFIGDALSTVWGKQVVVENRAGGGGAVGMMSVLRAEPDGYTLLMTTNGELALTPAINSNIRYDVEKELVPLVMATNNPIILAANVDSPYRTLADVVAAAKARPGDVAWASPGVGTWNHLTGEWLADALGIKLLHVPYRGGGPAGTALAAGEVPIGFVAISSALPHVQSGRVRVLALTTSHRPSFVPPWPTVAESAVPGFNSMQWVGLYAQSKLDPALRAKIERDVLTVLAQPALRQRFETAGIEVVARSSADAAKQIHIDSAIAKDISRKAGIKVE